jgi:phage tail tape-measure protein
MDEKRIDKNMKDEDTGAAIGGVGGAVTGAIAGAAGGPVGAIAGAVIGGVVGGVASKAAVHQVDKVDDDTTTTGVNHEMVENTKAAVAEKVDDLKGGLSHTQNNAERVVGGNGVPGIQTGGHAVDGTPDTRGITEKLADKLTGDKIDDKTGKRID